MKKTLKILLMLMLCLSVTLLAVSCNGNDGESDGSSEGSGEGTESGNGGTEGEGDDGKGPVAELVPYPCSACEDGEYTKETTPPTPFENGVNVFVCSSCGDSVIEQIPATGEIKILAIGDASIADSVSLLPEMLHGVGLNKVVVGTLACNFSSGASIEAHAKNIATEKSPYTLSINGDAENIKEYSQTFLAGLSFYEWDYIVIGQSIALAGLGDSYGSLADVLAYIDANKTNEYAKILWHMPWSFSNGSGANGFEEYGNDEDVMFEAIKDITGTLTSVYGELDGVIATGTAVQNIRSTFAGEFLKSSSIRLTDLGKVLAAYTWCSYLAGTDIEGLASLELSTEQDERYLRIAREAAVGAVANANEITVPETKEIKILVFGNSYSNDAITYLYKIFASAGYDVVVIGNISDGGCNIFNHWSNVDDTLEDFHPGSDYDGLVGYEGTAGCHISINGKGSSVTGATLKERYANTVAAYDWDYVSVQHAPKEVEQADTYAYLPNLLGFIKDNLTSEDTQFVFHMIWKYNDTLSNENQRTNKHYETIINIAKETVLVNEEFSMLIPAVTMRQNMSSSFLNDVDIARDYGHMGLTLGRYALGLLWYCVLTGGSVDDVTYVPTPDDVDNATKQKYASEYNHTHLEITEADMLVIKEAIRNALENPFEITQSQYVTAP